MILTFSPKRAFDSFAVEIDTLTSKFTQKGDKMSTVGTDMAKAAASKEQTNQGAGRTATSAKKLPGPAKKGGKLGNTGKPFQGVGK